MHGNLEPDEDVLDWDIEQIKKSYREGAKDYDRIMKEMEDCLLYTSPSPRD